MSKISINSLTSTIALMMASGSCMADQFHYINSPLGNRAGDMGGAYVAVSDDPAGAYYNPAGLVYANGAEMSASMNTFQRTLITYKSVIGGTQDYQRSSSTLVPNFFGITKPLGKGMLGFSYAVPNALTEDQDQTFKVSSYEYTINYNNNENTYNIGPSYAQEINDQLALGITLYGFYRHKQEINNVHLEFGSDRYWSNQYYESTEYGVKPILGVMWSPMKQLSLGFSASTTHIISSKAKEQDTLLNTQDPNFTNEYTQIDFPSSNEKADTPTNINVGAAWFPNSSLLVSADIIHHTGTGSGIDKRDAVTNLALGTEYYVSPKWALRGGLFTDFANTPDLKTGSANQLEHVDLWGITGSVTRFSRNASLTVGFNYSTGEGKAQILRNNTAQQDVEIANLGVYFAASSAF